MNIYDIIIVLFFLFASGLVYVVYWMAYCWAMQAAWPAGPAWFVCPKLSVFLAVCITGVILTLLLLRAAR